MRPDADGVQRQSRDHRLRDTVFLITAKIGPGVQSHLLDSGAGGRLPQGSRHRSPLPSDLRQREITGTTEI